MRSEEEIREEIRLLEGHIKKWPCSPSIVQEGQSMINILKWVLEEEPGMD
jgi:hypothetical protein